MRWKRSALFLFFWVFIFAGRSLFAQLRVPVTLRVRILDSHTHRALGGRWLQLTFTNIKGEWVSDGLMLKERTDKNGIATFKVGQPVPPRFSVFVWYGFPCVSQGDGFATLHILGQGLVAEWRSIANPKLKTDNRWCMAASNAPTPVKSPGELVIFLHPMNRFVWSWYDTWE